MWCVFSIVVLFFCFKQKTAYEMRISDWSSDVCSSDLLGVRRQVQRQVDAGRGARLAGRERQAERAGVGDAGRYDRAGIIHRIPLQRLAAAIDDEAVAVDRERAVAGEAHVGGARGRLTTAEALAHELTFNHI